MNDAQIAAYLHAKLPGALAELFDAYGDRLFRYCWQILRNREMAQIALRDTLLVAAAHIGRLADPQLFGPWLYALARAECRRRRAVQPSLADEPPARPSQRDADFRLMAWNAVTSMAADEQEALDLSCRHDVDLGLVFGLPAEDVEVLLIRSRQNLERALGAEILISRGGHACPDRAEMMSGWAGTMTPEVRDRVLEHAAGCGVCAPGLPRNVSAARVFAVLPVPVLPPLARAEILDFFDDHRLATYREFAVNRTSALAKSGFPLSSGPVAAVRAPSAPRPGRPRLQLHLARSGRILAAAGTIAAAATIACAFVLPGSGGKPVAGREITPAMAAAPRSGAAGQRPPGAGAAAAAGVGSGRPGVTPSLLPGAADPSGGRGEAIIADATAPLSPGQPPAPKPGAPAPAPAWGAPAPAPAWGAPAPAPAWGAPATPPEPSPSGTATSPQTVAVSGAPLASAQPRPDGSGRPHRHARLRRPVTSPSTPAPSGSSLPCARARRGRPARPGVRQALSWDRDRRAPFAYRPGQAGAPDQQGTGPALPGRLHRAELRFPARAPRRDDPVRPDH